MRRVRAFLAAAILLVLAPPGAGHAARSLETGSIVAADTELVVLEVEGCLYCTLFRRDVLPRYQASPRAQRVPIRFVDLNEKAADELGLDGPVLVVPTLVLIRHNREVGRVPGYVGPENFFHAVNHLLGPAD
jgi:thioredoxin-related protein